MGLMTSPYICTKMLALADEMVKGDPSDLRNPFQWAVVQLNLPGDPTYSPQLPWVYRTREDGSFASEVVSYVDDGRPVGASEERCWEAGHALACAYAWLGIQVSASKTRPQSNSGRLGRLHRANRISRSGCAMRPG